MRRISESAAVLIVVAALFLGLQYAASVTPQRCQDNMLRAVIPETPAYVAPGEDSIPPETTATAYGQAGLDNWYESTVTVSLTAADNGTGVSETEYSFDNYTWTDYEQPLNMTSEGTFIVYYHSSDLAGNSEPVKFVTIQIDMTAPVTTLSLEGFIGFTGWYFTTVTLTLSTVDAVSGVAYTQYSLGDGDWVNYSGPFVISQDGVHKLSFMSADLAGNMEGIQTTSLQIDRKAPTTIDSLSGKLGSLDWYGSDVTLVLAASDGASGVADTEYNIDGIGWTSYSYPITISGTGVHTIQFWSVDVAGNAEETRTILVKIDMTPPVTSAQIEGSKLPTGWYMSSVTVTLSAIDETSNIAYSEYTIDGSAWILYTGPITFVNDGRYEIGFKSADLAGNVENPQSVTIVIDRTPPTTIAVPDGTSGLNGWYTSPVIVTLVASDNGSGVADTEYSFDGIAWTSYFEPIRFFGDGTFTIYFYSSDNAYNTEETKTVTILIDQTAPVTTADVHGTEGQNGWYISDVVVTLTSVDSGSGIARVTYSLDGLTWTDYKEPIVIIQEGIWNIAFYAYDNAGNREPSESITVLVDKSAPVTTATPQGSPGLNSWYVSEVTVVLTAIDLTSNTFYTEYSFDGNSWFTYMEPIVVGTEGTTVLEYRSVDYAGNTETPSQLSISIDMTPPTTDIDMELYYSTGMIVLTATDSVSGVAHTYYRIDGVNWVEYTGPFQFSVTAGFNVIEYYSVDNAGNTEAPKSTSVLPTEVEVSSFVSHYPYPPCENEPLTSLNVYFVKHGRTGYMLITRAYYFWYNIEITNLMPTSIGNLSITPKLPAEFLMRGLAVWVETSSGHRTLAYMYLNTTHRHPIIVCPGRMHPVSISYDGHQITIARMAPEGRVWVTIAMEYSLRNTFFRSPQDFTTESYTFSTGVQALGTYDSFCVLPVVNHGVKSHCMTHCFWEAWIEIAHRHRC
ncbi:MAG: hypothetical protein C4K47_02710 [Candidatus Thorarchaeota archaeon]|nr:MAG: hypothetical protein C4K47_02710 [Candidatus Thorarchaeota archaeon]